MTWNYRVMRSDYTYPEPDDDGNPITETSFAIHEVYYSTDGNPISHTVNAVSVTSQSIDGLDWVLDRMREAISKPVLTAEDFPGPSRPT